LIKIRPASQNDIAQLTSLAIDTYTAAFGHSFLPEDLAIHLMTHLSEENISAWLERDAVLVAIEKDMLVGFVQFGEKDEPNVYELRRLYIQGGFQNKGIGGQLMQAALANSKMQRARKIYLDVWEENPGAIRFYERYGFSIVGRRKFEVASGSKTSDDLIMVREQLA
jgi:ribosomal protein S18 acetylase RimI-like enzyme